jgi:hypothetical protein
VKCVQCESTNTTKGNPATHDKERHEYDCIDCGASFVERPKGWIDRKAGDAEKAERAGLPLKGPIR